MRYVSYEKLKTGMCIARPIFDADGRVLLNSGVIINESLIARLKDRGVPGVFIVTDPDEDVDIPEVVSQQTRQIATSQIKSVFESVQVGKTFHVAPLSQSVNDIIDEITSNSSVLVSLTDVRTFDGYTFSHSVNVCVLAIIVGLRLNLDELQLRTLAMGAILHDLGKIDVPTEILHKKGPLTVDEYEQVKKHTVFGWNILRKNPGIPLLSAHIAYQHHEQPNGRGYPRQLLDEQIYLLAKIVGVVDAYDAMTSARLYRPAMQPSQALRVIKQLREIQFNTEIADCFIETVAPYPIGSRVVLNTREIGVVVDVNPTELKRPIVRVLYDADGSKYLNYYEVDLSKEASLSVIRCLH